MNISKTGLFAGMLKPKLAALLLLIVSLIGAKGKKDEKIRKDTIAVYIGSGLLLYFISVLCFYLNVANSIIAISYIGITALGYLLILTGGGRLSRLLKLNLQKDIFINMLLIVLAFCFFQNGSLFYPFVIIYKQKSTDKQYQ